MQTHIYNRNDNNIFTEMTTTLTEKSIGDAETSLDGADKTPLYKQKFLEFFKTRRSKEGSYITHTGMPGFMQGAFALDPNDQDTFMTYYKEALANGVSMNFIERPLMGSGPLLVDLDFRQDVTERLYKTEHVCKFIEVFHNILTELFEFKQEPYLEVSEAPKPIYYVLEKPPRPYNKDKTIYKDGIHILCPNIVLCWFYQAFIRERVLEQWDNIFTGCDFKNKPDDIYDESVLGSNGWIMYGSKKSDEPVAWKVSYTVTPGKGVAECHLQPDQLVDILSTRSANCQLDNFAIRPEKGDELSAFRERQNPKPKPVAEDGFIVVQNDVSYDKLMKIVMNLNNDRADGHKDWFPVLCAIVNVCHENGISQRHRDNIIHNFSMKCPTKYNENAVDGDIRKLKYQAGGIKFGSLMQWLKEDNKAAFDEVNRVVPEGCAIVDDPDDIVQEAKTTESDDYETVKKTFEQKCFKVKDPICYCEVKKDGSLIIRSEADFQKVYRTVIYHEKTKKQKGGYTIISNETVASSFLKKWFDDPNIRTYEEMNIYPPPLVCPPGTYNLWNGFAAERIIEPSSENVQPFIDHISVFVNHNEKALAYMLDWTAQAFQQPGKLVGIAPISRGEPGTGKGVFCDETLSRLVGKDKYFSTCDPSTELFSRFSVGRLNRIFINIDETNGRESRDNKEKYKRQITAPTYNHETKNLTPITVGNFNRFIFTTNNNAPVPIEMNDRRYFVFDTSSEKMGDAEYFNQYIKYIEEPTNQRAIYEFLMARPIDHINWAMDRPMNEATMELKALSISDVDMFFINICRLCPSKTLSWTSSQLYSMFVEWVKDNKDEGYTTLKNTMWGLVVNRIMTQDTTSGITKTKKSCYYYHIDTEKLTAYYKRRGSFDLELYFKSSRFLGRWCGVDDIETDDEP